MSPTSWDIGPAWLSGRSGLMLLGGVALAVVLMKLMINREPKARPLDEAGRVIGVVGRMGSGKSYFATRMAYKQMAAGADVWSNYEMHLGHTERCDRGCEQTVLQVRGKWNLFRSLDDLAGVSGDFETKRGRRRCVRRVVVFVDEAQDLFSSDAGRLGPLGRFVLKNLRKNGIDFYWMTQNEARVSKALKDLTNEIAVLSSERDRKTREVSMFRAAIYEPENVRKPNKALYRLKYKFDPVVGGLYSTSEIIVPDQELVDDRLRRVVTKMQENREDGGEPIATKEQRPPRLTVNGRAVRTRRGWTEPESREVS